MWASWNWVGKHGHTSMLKVDLLKLFIYTVRDALSTHLE